MIFVDLKLRVKTEDISNAAPLHRKYPTYHLTERMKIPKYGGHLLRQLFGPIKLSHLYIHVLQSNCLCKMSIDERLI